MNRTTRIKIGTLAFLLLLVALALLFAISVQGASIAVTIAIVLVALVLGRVQGHLWREFFKGRRLMSQGHYAEALAHFDRFLAELESRKWLRHAIWLGWSVYTLRPDVMTLTNIGACDLLLGQFDESERALKEAIRRDPLAPLPHFNLAVLSQVKHQPDCRDEFLRRAQDLGYRGKWDDALIHEITNAYAKVEGRG
ncbi:MAG TPA: hypothetical protein PLJ47_09665 [Candidatus Hydrogenedentes bacterium]|nr:hypothetical protein [Candidatus Hydrogenedentota bacterium]HRK34846.1 hypothetical protein [Candidatus Hydrogenedentota bacterium]